jgi:signal transduction histidine kinase
MRSYLLRYGQVPLVVAASVWLERLLEPFVDTGIVFLFLWPSVVYCGWRGLGPGLLATVLAILAADYFLIEPRYQISFIKPNELVWVCSFAGLAILINLLQEGSRRARRQVEELAHERYCLLQELKQADQHKNRFLGVLSHELRGPLSAARNATGVLKKLGSADSRMVQATELISRQLEQITCLVNDLLDLTRIERGTLRLEQQPLELATVIDLAVEANHWVLASKHLELRVCLPPDPVHLQADRSRLVQVVSNLLQNACNYTPEGGHISLTVEADHAGVVLMVQDDGQGISADMLPRVFDLFESLHQSRGGLGIGLALVRQLVELHDGSVTARSPGLGQGSTFVVRLPVGCAKVEEAVVIG